MTVQRYIDFSVFHDYAPSDNALDPSDIEMLQEVSAELAEIVVGNSHRYAGDAANLIQLVKSLSAEIARANEERLRCIRQEERDREIMDRPRPLVGIQTRRAL